MLNVELGHTPLCLTDAKRNPCHSCNSCSKTPNPEKLYGKVDTKLTFQELLVIRLAE